VDDVPYSPDLAYVHQRGYGFHGEATAPGVLALLEPVRRRGGLVHEFGAGTGALTTHLVAAGHRVVASDASPAMLALLRENVTGAEVRELRLPADALPPADAVVGVGHALNYLPDADSVRRGVLALGAGLRPGGVLAFDLCDVTYAAGRDAPFTLVGDDWTVITRFSRPSPERLVRDVTTFVREDDGRWRRGDERQVSTLVDTSLVPGWLAEVGVRAEVRPAFGDETLPPGLVAVVGARS
jgi:SAM-dependent methyltransferase